MKTLEELNALPDDELRVMLSNILNWELFKGVQPFMWGPGYKLVSHDYPRDLNACHAVEETLSNDQRAVYMEAVFSAFQDNNRHCWTLLHALPRQRTIALIFTLQPK